MFSKLIFVVEGKKIEFPLHELVWILQDIANGTQKIKTNPSIIPSYQDYADSIIKNFEIFSTKILSKYAAHYNVKKNKLKFILDVFYSGISTYFMTTPEFQNYLHIMKHIKSIEKPSNPYIGEEEFDQCILPPFIPPANNIFQWLGLISYTRETEEKIKSGWWVKIGERIILLRNLPTERQHLYVSDHGSCADVLAEVKQNSIKPNSKEGRERMSNNLSFYKHYKDNLTKEQKEHLKNHFIIMLHKKWGGDDRRNELLLHILSLPKWYQKIIMEDDKLNLPTFTISTSIGAPNNDGSSWIDPPEESILKSIPSEDYKQYSDIFDQILEKIRYLGDIQTKAFFNRLISGGLSPFFTQIDNIFNNTDAEHYKVFFVLNQLALELGKGLQQFLLRPPRSFGSAEEGESYRGFSRAFEQYFSLGSSLLKSPNELAVIIRSLLKGNLLQEEALYFLPNLVSAWFISEAARNETSVLSGLILLDLIESGVQLIDEEGKNLYSWKHVLIHPKKPPHTMDKVPIKDLYGEKIDLANFDGVHPMAHAGSIKDADPSKIGEKQKLSPVRQKEGHLVIHWLSERIKQEKPEMEHYVVFAKSESESTDKNPCCLLRKDSTSYATIDKLLKAKDNPSKSIEKDAVQKEKWKILHQVIIPFLTERFSTLDCLLKPVVISNVDTLANSRFDDDTRRNALYSQPDKAPDPLSAEKISSLEIIDVGFYEAIKELAVESMDMSCVPYPISKFIKGFDA